MNIFSDLGALAVASRLQRLSDILRKDAASIYDAFGIDFQPKWFPVIHALNRKGPSTIAEIATALGFAHTSVLQLVNELEQNGLVRSSEHASDGRKRIITKTPKATRLFSEMEEAWDVMGKALTQLMNTENNLLKALDEVEERFEAESFQSRALREMQRRKQRA